MPHASRILINHLNYSIPNDKQLFKELSLTFCAEKTGLIGKNGVGKSTLLKLIAKELPPDSGSIEITGDITYCPQELKINLDHTVADALGISEKIQAFQRVTAGSADENDFAIINDDWMIQEHTTQQLENFGLSHLDLNRKINSLSGGEKTRLMLAKNFLANPDFIILDEPTNNLDNTSRQFLYNAISKWNGGMLVVSHDRALLNLMNQIIELTSLGINIYGGNYDYFAEQKNLIRAANERELLNARKDLIKTQTNIQKRHERREQKTAYGRKLFKTGKIDKLTANSFRGRSEKTQSRNSKMNENLLKNAEENLQTAKSKIESNHVIDVALPNTFVPNGKVVVDIKNLTFGYYAKTPLIKNFNLKIIGPERIALTGNNGSGKTTLIKLILEELKPDHGKVAIGVERISYFDQNISLLNTEISVLENFKRLNPDTNETDAYFYLADFLFRNTAALKLFKDLSGGEKLRATLACVLMSKHPPQLLILDEPTNHLDFESIISIESALKHYQGAMIVISHDQNFLKNIGVEKFICAPFVTLDAKISIT